MNKNPPPKTVAFAKSAAIYATGVTKALLSIYAIESEKNRNKVNKDITNKHTTHWLLPENIEKNRPSDWLLI